MTIPRRRDATFEFSLSDSTTASANDFIFNITANTLIIPTGFNGSYITCVEVIIIGDARVESNETVVLDLRPLSDLDRVEFSGRSNSLNINILDGNLSLHCKEKQPVNALCV